MNQNLLNPLGDQFSAIKSNIQVTRSAAPHRAPSIDETRSPLIDAFPVTATITGGFNVIPINASYALGAITNASAWFPLIDVVPSEIFGQDVVLFGVDAELCSTNNTDGGALVDAYGVAAANQAPWGDKFGTKAALVVGSNLPMIPNSNSFNPIACPVPTLNSTIMPRGSQYFHVRTFPPGSFNDAIPFKESRWKPVTPYVMRVAEGERLQCALVIDNLQVFSGSVLAQSIVGFALVQLSIGMTRNPVSFEV